MKAIKRAVAVLVLSAAISSFASPAWANPPPPTNGGNGAGQSGQCTGNPDGRPAPCPGS
jgi:hypothetical protein